MNTLTKLDFCRWMRCSSRLLEEAQPTLTLLDAQMGDGDLGLTICKGFSAASNFLEENAFPSFSLLLQKVGFLFASEIPSTIGTLLASGFLEAGKRNAYEVWDTFALASFWYAFCEGIQKRGHAQRGQRTILDALLPAADALQKSALCAYSLQEACQAAAQAAYRGYLQTKTMIPCFGKALVFKQSPLFCEDAGALAGALLLRAWYKTVCAKKRRAAHRPLSFFWQKSK